MNCWPMVPLGEVVTHRKEFVTISDAAQYKRPRVQLHAKGVVLRDVVTGADIKTKSQQVCRNGEFLVAEIDAKVGGFGIVTPELDGAIVSSHYFLFDLKPERLDARFLEYFTRTAGFQEQVNAQGSTNYAAVRPWEVLGYRVPLPPLPEQRRIVAKIDALAARIAEAQGLRREAASKADAIWTAVLNEAYHAAVEATGKPERLDNLCVQITDGTHSTPRYVEAGVPFLSVKDVTSGIISFNGVRFIDPLEHAQLVKRCRPERGDVLLTKVGTTGFAKAIDVDQEFSIFVSLALLKLNKARLRPTFTEHMLNSGCLREYSRAGTRGIGNQNLVLKFIREFPVPAPPLPEQDRIVERLGTMRRKLDVLERSQAKTAAELDAVLPAILDRAFRGEL